MIFYWIKTSGMTDLKMSLQILSETFLILRKLSMIQWNMCNGLYAKNTLCKVHFIVVRFLLNLNPLAKFSKNTQIPKFIKIRPLGAELFLGDRRTDMTKLIAKSAYKRWAVQQKDIWNHSTLLAVSSDEEPSWTLPVTQITRSTVHIPSSHREAK
jgi:hypothetical protein